MTIATITTAPEAAPAACVPADDLRHRPAQGRMRDSLFWQVTMPEKQLGLQAYLYLTDRNRCGFNMVLWGRELDLVELGGGEVAAAADFDDFRFGALALEQPELGRTATVRFHGDKLRFEYRFTALHEPFSYRQNPDGLPSWFAENRYEQTGWVSGFIEHAGGRIEFDRIGHRDHSWGVRDWGVPQHWKWFVAYTPAAERIVNGWIWIAEGQWGFAGYVVRDGELLPIAHMRPTADYHADMSQKRLDVEVIDARGGSTRLTLESFGVAKLPTNDKMDTLIYEAACAGTIDGRPAAGQFETHWQRSYLNYLVERRAGAKDRGRD